MTIHYVEKLCNVSLVLVLLQDITLLVSLYYRKINGLMNPDNLVGGENQTQLDFRIYAHTSLAILPLQNCHYDTT